MIENYEEEGFLQSGRKSKCRVCDEDIRLDLMAIGWRKGQWRGRWMHLKEDGTTVETSEAWSASPTGHEAMPTMFCMWSIESKSCVCGKPVKYEDMEAKNFACGKHMRKELDQNASIRLAAERETREKAATELAKYEIQQYGLARARLINLGLQIFDDYEPNSENNRYASSARYFRLNKLHKIDVMELEQQLMALLQERRPDEYPSGKDAGEIEQLHAAADDLFS